MLFTSLTFLFIFLPISILLYYLVPWRFKNALLVIISLIFYAWGEPVYIVLLLLSTLMNYCCGLDIERKKGKRSKARGSLIFGIVINVAILGFMEYFPLLIDGLDNLFYVQIPYRTLSLPIGLSCYTLYAISYLMDVYRGEAAAQRNFINLTLYISFFTKILTGPIIRYEDMEAQLQDRTLTTRKFSAGLSGVICGLTKQAVLASVMMDVYGQVAAMEAGTFSALTAWVGCLAFTFQIYFSLSGHSDMASGLSRIFGFEFPRNYDYPYTANSVTDFWDRWNISLVTWFREYVYLPMGGNRGSVSTNVFNLLVVWMLLGFWHGSSITFLIWGLYFGLLLALERFVLWEYLDRIPSALRYAGTFILIMVGWVFFFSPGVGSAFRYIGSMIGIGAKSLVDRQAFYLLGSHWLGFLLCIVGSSHRGQDLIRTITEGFKRESVCRVAYAVVYLGMFLISVAYLLY